MLDREKILEVLAFWRTRITAAQLGNILMISRQSAQDAVIAKFRRDYAGELTIQKRGQGLPDGNTLDETVCGDPDTGNLFHLLVAIREFGLAHAPARETGRETILGFPAEEVRMPEPEDAAQMRRVSAAASHRRAVIGTYSFKERGVTRVRFSPHAMVRTPLRIHFRGFLETSTDSGSWTALGYRDLVPHRFIEIEEKTQDASLPGRDEDWHKEDTLVFHLNAELPHTVRAAFAREYGLEPGEDGRYEIRITNRRAYSHYYRAEIFSRKWGPEGLLIWIESALSASS